MEDPRRLEPAERECLVTTEVDDGRLLLRGYIDRLDISRDRRPAGGRLQDRRRAARGVRGAGAVPAQVLRAGAVAHPRRGAPGAAPALPQGRGGLRLHPRHRGAGPVRAHPGRALGGHRAGHRGTRLPPEAEPAVRLVLPPGAVPGVRRHSAAVPRARRGAAGQSPTARSRTSSGSWPSGVRCAYCSPTTSPCSAPDSGRRWPAQSDLHVVGEAGDGVEAVELARRLLPDVVLLDARAAPARRGGHDAARSWRPGCRCGCSCWAASTRATRCWAALRAGARGYLARTSRTARSWSTAVRTLAAGGAVTRPGNAGPAARPVRRRRSPPSRPVPHPSWPR